LPKENGQWGIGVIVSNLNPKRALADRSLSPEGTKRSPGLWPTFISTISAAARLKSKSKRINSLSTTNAAKTLRRPQILTQLEVWLTIP
jgi:hypothetical protein